MDERQQELAKQIGKRVRTLRGKRGLTLRELAGLAGVSNSYLSMIEGGKRLLKDSSYISALADALKVAPAELLGQPFLPTDPHATEADAAIPALRLTLMGMTLGSPPDRRPPAEPVTRLAARVRRANRLYHSAEYGALAVRLPELLADLQAAAAASEGRTRLRVLRLLADAYHPACTLMLKSLGYTDLAFIAVTRASEAIAELEDPVYTALSGFFATHILMAAGSPQQALSKATATVNLLERHLDLPNAEALLGELHLISATTITKDPNRPAGDRTADVRSHLTEATRLAAGIGETRAFHLNFGPTNVQIHRVSLNTDLGHHGDAVTAGTGVHPEIINAPGRQAAYHSDLGRALVHVRGQESAAAERFLRAELIAPQRVHADALIGDSVSYLLGKRLPSHVQRDLAGLAHRMGISR
ncbi:transcriptional regulator [Streptomyces sp. WZ.A104]|uniref:helix-turn-helix domain-containing protein n=1 Tax=Streptomyces sp. WZ.A104 TaxID=2023771 RepID=UPI000BBB96BF|nr:helix-turn-helix domain-containing protein [Streptomyces sp. WZ.A104]PCG87140.1 transcriptional regulator [Streptomyces sp. WZ.A104]